MTEIPNTRIIHPEFHLNGFPHTRDTLMDAAYSLIKEGEPYELSIGDFLMDWLVDESTVTLKTSGTTGAPKRLEVPKEKLIVSAERTGAYFDLNPGNSCLLCLPADYIAGKMMLVRALVLGLHLHFVEPSASPIPLNLRFDFTAMVPMQLRGSLKRLDQVKKILVGGAPVPADLYEPIHKSLADIYETYGMTETLTHVAVRRLNHTMSGGSEHVFSALPGVQFGIDERGCLIIDDAHLEISGRITNDMVDLISPTEFIWKGRYDNVINTGGVKVSPETLEQLFSAQLGIDVLVSSVPDEKLGEMVIAIAEGEMKIQDIEIQIDKIDNLNSYEKPKQWYSLERFERNESGKLDRSKTLKKLEL